MVAYPFAYTNPNHRSKNQRPTFNEPGRPCAPRLVDLVHVAVDLVHRVSFRKIIQKFLKIAGASYFCKNTPELFQNSILVLVILHLGPRATFYIYN
jgi:hypothetical protein